MQEACGRGAGVESGLALTSWVTLAGQLLSGSNMIIDTEAFLHKHGGCSATEPPRANLTAAPTPRRSLSPGYEGGRGPPAAQSPEAAEEWENGGWAPPLPTSGMLFAYRRSWDLFPLAVFQPKPVLMPSR